MKKLCTVLGTMTAAAFFLTACGVGAESGGDLLSDIKSRGYMIVSTNRDLAPQSYINTDGQRSEASKCPSDTLSLDQMQGFDVDVSAELAKRLGVEVCFSTPDWGTVAAGSWNGQWDIYVGSMVVTRQLQQFLDFTEAYYYGPVAVAVIKDSGITALDQLANQTLCASSPSDEASWLKGQLDLPTQDIFVQPPANVKIYPASSGQECAALLHDGKRDFAGYVDTPAAIDQNISAGVPIVRLGGPVFADNMAVAVDKSSTHATGDLLTALDGFIKSMHTDGTLTTLSQKWFQTDLTQPVTR